MQWVAFTVNMLTNGRDILCAQWKFSKSKMLRSDCVPIKNSVSIGSAEKRALHILPAEHWFFPVCCSQFQSICKREHLLKNFHQN